MRGCGFGPCENSLEMGGGGCHLCDITAHLPQPKFKSKGALVDDETPDNALGIEPDAPVAAGPQRRVAPPPTKKRAAKGPQSGSLL